MIEVVTYKPELESDFVRLNTDWIKKYFRIEPHDIEAFADVSKIVRDGGQVFFALSGGVAVGCCSLVHHQPPTQFGEWELAKMAVDENCRGEGLGNRLMEALLSEAERRGVAEIYLEGNTHLTASIAMYRKFGFVDVPLSTPNYDRVDIIMKWRNAQKSERS